MLRSPLLWLSALWIGVLIHVDSHLGRPGHDHLSFGLSYHWLLGVIEFAPIAWLFVRRWPSSLMRASLLVVMLGVLIGQGVEPFGEVIAFEAGADPFTNSIRWRVFAEFMLAGILAYILIVVVPLGRSIGLHERQP